jgi:hypothetical protein
MQNKKKNQKKKNPRFFPPDMSMNSNKGRGKKGKGKGKGKAGEN